ncbi:hypothetical protein HPC49_54385 [Pyxidicoccus fallax]|uniref:Lipoprotein n=1 Tax=Pyxidicoccus fallax TaxID=394095 RepID=A0A848LXL4_9BACT|nr:hypothetical protein [Pyxidicoccus fallax]NMO22908.1 hypothetical protein [Pyxidicoccus fallax]NPC87156.1 hypothetical protein [Pyxidicoccus fallax]
MTTRRWLLGAAVALALTGCASNPKKTLLERTGSYVVYDLPAQQVMDAAEAELGARGYSLLPSTDPLFLHTPWKVRGNHDVFTAWSRRYIEGRVRPDGRLVLRAYKVDANVHARTQLLPGFQSSDGVTPEDEPNTTPTEMLAVEPVLGRYSTRPVIRRDLELEWAILERLNPEFAGRVKTQVDVYLAEGAPARNAR